MGNAMTAPQAYVAGPLFDEGERWWIETVERAVASCGYRTFLPHRDNPAKTQDNVAEIFANDRRGIDASVVLVANLNGITTDDGTAWEIGYAYAKGIPVVGLHTDWRRRFDHEVVNLMIECSLVALVHSIDGLCAELIARRTGSVG
jgi:nucleoside 2-deoxyribosyltransferase